MPSDEYYRLMGLDRNASSKEIKAVHRKLAKRYHSDPLGQGASPEEIRAAEEYFKRLQEAYEAIYSDAIEREKRKEGIDQEYRNREEERERRERENRERERRIREERERREREEEERLRKQREEQEKLRREEEEHREKEARLQREREEAEKLWYKKFFAVALVFGVLLLGYWALAPDSIDSPTSSSIPAPQLALSGTESYTASGQPWMRYRLVVTNWAAFPAELFEL